MGGELKREVCGFLCQRAGDRARDVKITGKEVGEPHAVVNIVLKAIDDDGTEKAVPFGIANGMNSRPYSRP